MQVAHRSPRLWPGHCRMRWTLISARYTQCRTKVELNQFETSEQALATREKPYCKCGAEFCDESGEDAVQPDAVDVAVLERSQDVGDTQVVAAQPRTLPHVPAN